MRDSGMEGYQSTKGDPSRCVYLGLMSLQERGHTETGPQFKVRKTGEAGDRSFHPWVGSLVRDILHYDPSKGPPYVVIKTAKDKVKNLILHNF